MANDTSTHKLKVGELAKIAGVSASTVSKVINGRPGISDETRRQVEQILKDHGYSRPLVNTKLSPTIELVVEYIEHNGTMELIKYASYWAQQAGLAITVTQTNHGDATEDCFRGIIDPIDTVDSDVMSVSIDNWTAGYQAGKHLLSLGHRRIAVIRGPANLQTSIARYSGFTAALQQAGVDLPESYIEQGDYFPAETSYEAACRLLELTDRPTAIFCCNDLSAVSTYRAAREHKIALPKQLSVMGFDDIFPAGQLMPSLTSVHQPFSEIAQRAVQMIIDSRKGNQGDMHVILPTSVVTRESTVPPQSSAR
ncbi:LacI family DNA-binding transcriptional regulator [Bifidobacterium breve]|uniref:LacI family DNA-binding transcriptional regulator n=1 Tax=Bifidobacterium breve TaxID=1685 RepID=UPI0022AED952|nr:LacI family DNA-binding transcriptional regulator [Bifidobacterium breve]MCZ4468135.1 LacI family DNA-binding transcriptional regulator [Bifidobacterium breve]